jgi:hypothetical protein
MRLADEDAHLALTYAASLRGKGYRVTRKELEAYIAGPQRRSAPLVDMSAILSPVINAIALLSVGQTASRVANETVVDHLLRMLWANVDDQDRVSLTDLGEAVLRVLDDTTAEEASPIEAVLSGKDPIAYAKLIGKISELGDCLLIDQYLRADDLFQIAANTEVTQVLCCLENLPKKDRTTFEVALPAIISMRSLAVRSAPRGRLHDRFCIPKSSKEPILLLGTSLNAIGKGAFSVVTRLTDPKGALRAECHQHWEDGTPVATPGGAGASQGP